MYIKSISFKFFSTNSNIIKMIIKSYEVKKNKSNILKNNLFLLYGENIGLKKDINNMMTIIDLVILTKFEKSKSEIRRLIKGNAIKLNDEIISDEKFIIEKELFQKNYFKLSIGKKRHIKIELN